MSEQYTDDMVRLLREDERSKKLVNGPYQDEDLEVKIKGPDVRSDEYYERFIVTELAGESKTLHGWRKLQLPADSEIIDEFISVLIKASNRLSELEDERSVDVDTDRTGGDTR